MLLVNHLIGFGGRISGPAPCTCTPAYATGDRNSSIDLTASHSPTAGTITNLIDGGFADNNSDGMGMDTWTAGEDVTFDFKAGNSFRITAARYYQVENNLTQGDFTIAGSNDDSSYTNLGTWTDMGTGGNPDEITFTNETGYRYYRIICDSFTANGARGIEFEFEQCDCNA